MENQRVNREENIEVFNNTSLLYETLPALKESIVKSKQYTQVIPEGKPVEWTANDSRSRVTITKSKTFDAARKYTEGKTAVLNFASATTPGGGVVKGANAQEECLCRCSTLYSILNDKRCWDEFYAPHREKLNALHNDDIIWVPDVIVFKTDDYDMLPEAEWKSISVITCAAPNLREKNVGMFNVDKKVDHEVSKEELYAIHLKRAKRVLAIAARKGVVNLVLGAFGCGAFKNDPETVALAWKAAVDQMRLDMNIEFAVYDGLHTNNFEVFKRVFEL